MDNALTCNETVVDVLKDSSYSTKYTWESADNCSEAQELDKQNGYAMAQFITALLEENNAPCVEEVIGLLEEFIQECKATDKTLLLEELQNALHNAG